MFVVLSIMVFAGANTSNSEIIPDSENSSFLDCDFLTKVSDDALCLPNCYCI
jgi:hypothetical protein